MIRNLRKGTGTCVKALLFSAVALMSSSASARVEDHGALTTDSTYQLKMFVDHTFTLVAPKSGLLRIRCNDGAIVVNPNLDANGKADASNNYAQNTFEEYKDAAGNRFTSVYEVYVKKGEKLYVSNLNNMSKTNFLAHIETEGMDKVSVVTRNYAENETFDISDTRYGQFFIRVNMPFAASDSAYLSVPGYPTAQQAAAGYGRLKTRTDPNNNKDIRWQLKDSISDWMARGIIKGGEVITLKLNSLRSLRYGDEVYYGEDGSIEFHFTAPSLAAIHKLVDKNYPNPFLSYYVKGDESGLIKLNFDYDVMPIADGQTAKVSLRMGSAESSDVYGEEYDAQTAGQETIKVDGKSLIIDLTGKLRTIDAMGLSMNWGSYTLRVQNVKMADGTNAYTDSKGSSGSYTITLPYREFFSTIAVQYVPDAEETLDDNEITAYFSEKNDIDFSAVKISYQDKTTDEAKEAVIEKKDIEAIEAGENAIRYIIPITDEIKNAKNVRISYVGIVAKDGQEHPELDVRFNPGPELINTLAPSRVSPKDGAYVDGLKELTLTFAEEPVVDPDKIEVTDETTGETVVFATTTSGKTVTLAFNGIENLHTYSVAFADGAIGNTEFNETEGKYGNYMTATTYTFTAYHSEAGLDFIPQPLDGSTLSEIATVDLYGTSSRLPLHYSNNLEKKVWIEDAEGNILQEATAISEIGQANIRIKFEPAFKGNGQYNVVIGDSIYFYGEGYEALDPNETVRKIPYTLSAPAEKTFTVDALPASDTNVTTLSQVFLTADEPVYLNETTVTAFNQVSRKSIDGKLTKDPDTEYGAMITFDSEITDKGTWNITIPAGVFGDKTWFESQGTTGKCNDLIDLYYDVTGKVSQDITADPENGSTVGAIYSIALTFGQEIGQGYGQTAYVRDENGLRVAAISSENNVELDWDNYNRATVTLSEPITAAGEYTIAFPKGFFTDAEGFDIDAFDLTYTVEGGDTPEPGEGISFTATPEDKAAVKTLKDITLVFDTNEIGIGSGMITVKNAITGEQIARLDADIQYPEDYWNDPINTAVISLPTEISDANVKVITVEIPAGYFQTSEGESQAIKLTYYVGDNSTAINGVAADAQNTAVYNLNGVRVSVKADGVKALPKGVYIIGGKKVVNK